MRNLKKVLSLALAMVMLLGMMVVGAGATSFKDDADITHKEAVDVVSGIGVLQGVDDGSSFSPKGTLSRAEAAVVIAKLDLGAAFGNLATTNASTFKDVGAGYGWAKPYIDYCAARGLIAGDGNGYFMPGDKVTGVQFALMVARVLGYVDRAEGVGSNTDWEVKAAALARKAGLTDNVTIGSNAITRDDMAQVAYNALQADMVYYRTPGTEINIGGDSIIVGNTPAEPKGNSLSDDYRETPHPDRDSDLQLCEEKFPDLKLRAEEDDFDRDVYTWYNAKVEIGSYQSEEPTFTFTASVSGSDMTKNLRGYHYGDTSDAGVLPVTNGKNNATTVTKAADETNDHIVNSVADLTGNGRVVEVYADKDRIIEKIVVVNTQLMTIKKVSDKEVTLSRVQNSGETVAAVDDENPCFAALSGMKADDYVLVTPVTKNNGTSYIVAEVAEPEIVEGALTRIDKTSGDNSAVTVAGTSYSYGANRVTGGTPNLNGLNNSNLTSATKKDAVLFLDSYGYAIYIEDVATVTNYLYVISTWQNMVGGKVVTMAHGIAPDGTVVDINIGSGQTVSGTPKLVSYAAASDANVNLYGAEYDVTALAAGTTNGTYIDVGGTAISKGQTHVSSIPYSGSVKFIYFDSATNTVSVLDGVQTKASAAAGTASALVQNNAAGSPLVTAVFVSGIAPDAAGQNVLYVIENKGNTSVDGSAATLWDVYINGEKQTITVRGTAALTANTFHLYSYNEEKDLYSVTTTAYTDTGKATSVVVSTALSNVVDDRLITFDGSNYLVTNNDTVVIDLRSGVTKIDSVKELAELKAGNAVTVSVIYNGATNDNNKGLVSCIFVEGAKKVYGATDPEIDTATELNARLAAGEDVTISGNYTVSDADLVIDKGSLTVTGDLTVTGHNVEVKGGETLNVSGHNITATTLKVTDGTVSVADVTGAVTVTKGDLTSTGTVTGNVQTAATAGTVALKTLTGNIDVDGGTVSVESVSGTIDVAATKELTITGAYTFANATITNAGTIKLTNTTTPAALSANKTISGTWEMDDLSVTGSATLTLDSGAYVTVKGTLLVSGTAVSIPGDATLKVADAAATSLEKVAGSAANATLILDANSSTATSNTTAANAKFFSGKGNSTNAGTPALTSAPATANLIPSGTYKWATDIATADSQATPNGSGWLKQ